MRFNWLWTLAGVQLICLFIILLLYRGQEIEEPSALDGAGNNFGPYLTKEDDSDDTDTDDNKLIKTEQDEEDKTNKIPKILENLAKDGPDTDGDGMFSPLRVSRPPIIPPPRPPRVATRVRSDPKSRSVSFANKDPSDNFTVAGGVLGLKGTRFVLHNSQICNYQLYEEVSNGTAISEPSPILLILVRSKRGHFLARQTIRNTYGSLFHHGSYDIRVIFLIGKGRKNKIVPVDVKQQDVHIRLAWEFEVYADLILGPFYDTEEKFSASTTYAHVMGIRWAMKHCNRSEYIVAVNDDQFVDTLEIVGNSIPAMKRSGASFFCKKSTKEIGQRDEDEQQQPPFKDQLEYCSGGAYLADYEAMKKLFLMISTVPFNEDEHDDVFVTGRLRQAYLDRGKDFKIFNDSSLILPQSPHPTDNLKIFSFPLRRWEDQDTRCFYAAKWYIKIVHLAFHKYKDSTVKEGWCYWWNALSIKGKFGLQEKKFIWSAMAQ